MGPKAPQPLTYGLGQAEQQKSSFAVALPLPPLLGHPIAPDSAGIDHHGRGHAEHAHTNLPAHRGFPAKGVLARADRGFDSSSRVIPQPFDLSDELSQPSQFNIPAHQPPQAPHRLATQWFRPAHFSSRASGALHSVKVDAVVVGGAAGLHFYPLSSRTGDVMGGFAPRRLPS